MSLDGYIEWKSPSGRRVLQRVGTTTNFRNSTNHTWLLIDIDARLRRAYFDVHLADTDSYNTNVMLLLDQFVRFPDGTKWYLDGILPQGTPELLGLEGWK